MSTDTATRTTEVFRIYIKATPERIWEAITDPEWNGRYGYHAAARYELTPGGAYECWATDEMKAHGVAADLVIDGEVLEVDPPHRLVQTFRFNFEEAQTAEGFTTLTWEITPEGDELCHVTITHDVTDAPLMAGQVTAAGPVLQGGGGWAWVLSDLKSLLETGEPAV